jgi:hypothetical protein
MGYLSYALTTGARDGASDWRPEDETVTLREWLMFAAREVPRLYARRATATGSGGSRYIVLLDQRTLLQTPTLFDFRGSADEGFRWRAAQ